MSESLYHAARYVQIFDGVLQKVDTHVAQTSACATTVPVNAFDNPIHTNIHRVEGEEIFVLFVVVVAFVVGGVHLHL